MIDVVAQTPLWIWWLLLAIFLIVAEVFAPTFVLFWFAIGALTALVGALIPEVSFPYQLIIFGSASLGGLFFLRPYFKARSDSRDDGRELNDFETNLVGASGVLTVAISGGKGRARIGDSTWLVTGPDLPAKTRIRVTSVNGIQLGVKIDEAY